MAKEDFGELEMFLKEIPNATSVKFPTLDSSPLEFSSDSRTVFAVEGDLANSHTSARYTNFHNSPQLEKHSSRISSCESMAFAGSPYDRKICSTHASCGASSTLDVDQSRLNLAEDAFLVSAFGELSFKDGVTVVPPEAMGYKTSSSNLGSPLGRQHLHRPPPACSSNQSMQNICVDDSVFLENGDHLMKKVTTDTSLRDFRRWQPSFSFHNEATHVDPGMHALKFFRQIPVQEFQFAAPALRQERFMDPQLLAQLSSNHADYSDFMCRNMEDVKNYSMNPYSLYPQQFQSQHRPQFYWNQEDMNSSILRSCFGTSMSCGIEQGSRSQDSCHWNGVFDENSWNMCREGRGLSISDRQNLAYSAKAYVGHGLPGKVGNKIVPEKVLTMSHLDYENSLHRISEQMELKYQSVDEIVGRIYLEAKDNHGCRFLQEKLKERSPEDIGKIFVEIIGHIGELMIDPFGNYVVQELVYVCNDDQRTRIIHALTKRAGELIDISCDNHGTRVVQKVIETLKTTKQSLAIVSSLKPRTIRLIKDINGNHVAQRCLQYLSPEHNEFLFEAAISHFIELAKDRQGCCVLQKCIYHFNWQWKQELLSKITSNALNLARDQFGNYVVQFALDQNVPWVTFRILDQLMGNFGELSLHKHGSHVVEKCLKMVDDRNRARIIGELTSSPQFLEILQDQYGNYVIKSSLRECKGPLLAALVEAIRPHIPVLRSSPSPYGKILLSNCCLKQ